MSYKEDVSKSQGLGNMPDFCVVRASAPHRAYLLNQKGPTVIRIYPALAGGNEVSFRVNDGEGEFSDWIHYEPLLRYYGVNSKATAFLRVKGQTLEYKGPLAVTQYSLFQLTRHAGVGTYPQEWKAWFKKDENDPKSKGPALSAPDGAGLLQGMLFEHGGRRLVGPDGRSMNPVHPIVLVLNKTARQWLEAACNTPKPGLTTIAGLSFEDRYALGDIVQLSKGRLISFNFQPASSTTTAHYTGLALDQCVPLPLPLVANEWRPWDEILDFMDEQQQVALLCRIFPDDVVDYALGSHPDFSRLLPDRVRGAYARRMGHTSVAAGAPAAPAQPTYQAPAVAQAAPKPPASPQPSYTTQAQPSFEFKPTPVAAAPAAGVPGGAMSNLASPGGYTVDFSAGPRPVTAPAANIPTPPELQTPPSAPTAAPGQPTGDSMTDAAKYNTARFQLQEAIRAAGGQV